MSRPPAQRPGRSRQDYGTPVDFVAAVERGIICQRFAIDLAADATNAKVSRFLSPKDDALSLPWHELIPFGSWGWLNPPFANIEVWVAKAVTESLQGARVAMLLPASVGTNWFKDHVYDHASGLWLSPRMTFVGERDPYPKDLMLLLYDGPRRGFSPWRWKE